MSLDAVIAPTLFDSINDYSRAIVRDKGIPDDPPLTFCDNFYLQFFQNRLGHEITGYGKQSKESAVRLRDEVTGKESQVVLLLITSFERYCDVRYDVFSETYGGEGTEATGIFLDYLQLLLERISAWAAAEKLAVIQQSSDSSLMELKAALKAI